MATDRDLDEMFGDPPPSVFENIETQADAANLRLIRLSGQIYALQKWAIVVVVLLALIAFKLWFPDARF